jgi:hypothetical protein
MVSGRSSRGDNGGAPADEAEEPPPTVGGVSRSGGYVPEVIGEELPPALLEVNSQTCTLGETASHGSISLSCALLCLGSSGDLPGFSGNGME